MLLTSVYGHASFSDLYETCNWKNKAFTQRIINEAYQYCPLDEKDDLSRCVTPRPYFMTSFCHTPACSDSIVSEIEDIKKITFTEQVLHNHIPKECFLTSQALGVHLWPAEKYTYYYCHSSQSSQTLPKMEFHSCKSKGEACRLKTAQNTQPTETTLANRPPCLNHRYIHLISRAFNQITDCFGFTSKREKEKLFALFHHEARFLLNKVEEYDGDNRVVNSTNRCFGQMKNDFIEELNKYIYFGDRDQTGPRSSRWYKYGDIYKEAIKTCPFLEQAVTPKPVYLQGTVISPENTFGKAHVSRKQDMICKTSQDPNSCLLYSVFNAKVNLLDMFDNLRKNYRTITHSSWPGSIKQKVPKTTKYNEMLVVTTHNEEGSFIKDSANPYINYNDDNVSIKKIPLFKNEEELIWTFVLYAHNGGGTVISDRFIEFMKQLKDKITNPDCKKDPVCNRHRNSVLKGEGLKTAALHREFARYAVENKIANNEELSQFMNKINRDTGYFSGSEGSLKQAVTRLHAKSKNQTSDENVNQFLNYVKTACPTRL